MSPGIVHSTTDNTGTSSRSTQRPHAVFKTVEEHSESFHSIANLRWEFSSSTKSQRFFRWNWSLVVLAVLVTTDSVLADRASQQAPSPVSMWTTADTLMPAWG